MLASGRLRHRVEIWRGEKVKGDKGERRTSWRKVATVRAEVIGLDGRESVMDKVLRGISVYQVTIRWRADVLPSDQLKFRGRDLDIKSAVDPDNGRREQLKIIADTDGAEQTS